MKVSTWRMGFLDWLQDQIQIDSYFLEAPEAPGMTNVFLPPLRNIKNYEADDGYHSTATQDVYISTRYDRSLAYYQLPINVVEGTYCTLMQQLIKEQQGIADLIEVIINPSEDAIAIGELGDDRGDWIITMKMIITIRFVITPEVEDDRTLYPHKINLGLYREYLDESDRVLDQIITSAEVISESEEYLLTEPGNTYHEELQGDIYLYVEEEEVLTIDNQDLGLVGAGFTNEDDNLLIDD